MNDSNFGASDCTLSPFPQNFDLTPTLKAEPPDGSRRAAFARSVRALCWAPEFYETVISKRPLFYFPGKLYRRGRDSVSDVGILSGK